MKTKYRRPRPVSPQAAPACTVLSVLASFMPIVALAGDLTVDVSAIAQNRGRVFVAVYDSADAFPTPGRQAVARVLDADSNHLTVSFKNLPPGQYAVVAFQDFNANGKLDKNFLGIPKEPYGFSNGARGTAGPPKFSAAAVTLNDNALTRIELK
jgi:uncharacterized protein (DUF2141 family)